MIELYKVFCSPLTILKEDIKKHQKVKYYLNKHSYLKPWYEYQGGKWLKSMRRMTKKLLKKISFEFKDANTYVKKVMLGLVAQYVFCLKVKL